MTGFAVLLVLAAAAMHATWNAMLRSHGDRLWSITVMSLASTLGALPAFLLLPSVAGAAWPYIGLSASLHVGYSLVLVQAYRHGDFLQVYPIARGSAPLLVTVLAAVFAHEVPDGWATGGVLVSCAGLTGVALWGLRGRRPDWAAIGAALATGVTIAAYTVVDGLGVRASGSSFGYIAWLMAVQGTVIPLYALCRWGRETGARLRPHARLGLLGAALSVAAYALVLWAQTRAALAPVAALRESSIIVGAAIGALFFKERFGAPRIAAAGLLVVGIGLMLRAG